MKFNDAVHGTVEFDDPRVFARSDLMHALLGSPHIQRLRRIRQIPFGPYGFLSATHTRYSHAIGTSVVAYRLLQRLNQTGFFDSTKVAELRASVPALSAVNADDGSFVTRICEHVVVAGLLQDIGELPHKPSTGLFLYPQQSLSARIEAELNVAAGRLSGKEIFTVHGIIETFRSSSFLEESLDLGLVVYLITGLVSSEISESDSLRAVRQVVDGVVDADRLDYVHRDSHHSLGQAVSMSASAVIDSLLRYDKDGPIFAAANPVSNFLMHRAILRSEVYSAPEIRFRDTLLAVVLSELLRRHPEWMAGAFSVEHGALTAEAFLQLDDVSLFGNLNRLRHDLNSVPLDVGPARALDLLLTDAAGYEFVSLDRPDTPTQAEKIALRPDVFVDSFWDYEPHRLYQPAAVRISGSPYSASGETVALEETAGHVSDFFRVLWDSPPVQNKVLFFVPSANINWFLSVKNQGPTEQQRLYATAVARDAEIRLSVVDDTRAEETHSGPAIFVSFCWEDIDTMRAVLRLLYEHRRKYFSFVEDYHGLGGNTRANSAAYASQADAAIILFSKAYAERGLNTAGNIYAELEAMGRRLPADLVVPIALDPITDYGSAIETFPWPLIGFSEPPFMGVPIRNAPTRQIFRALEAALKKIDGHLAEIGR